MQLYLRSHRKIRASEDTVCGSQGFRPKLPCPMQEALLAAISEKDANIALLELSASKKKKTQEEVMALKREKDRLVHQLKQQVGPHARKVCFAGLGPWVLSLGLASLHLAMSILQAQAAKIRKEKVSFGPDPESNSHGAALL
ncbi:hypothetical protein CB1_000714009 [Camelus ferus]|nr:hypothetical protein CB1_000714009 [Camelus ferus]